MIVCERGAENCALHDSPLNNVHETWLNERTTERYELFFLPNWPTGTESRTLKSTSAHYCSTTVLFPTSHVSTHLISHFVLFMLVMSLPWFAVLISVSMFFYTVWCPWVSWKEPPNKMYYYDYDYDYYYYHHHQKLTDICFISFVVINTLTIVETFVKINVFWKDSSPQLLVYLVFLYKSA